MSYIFLRVLVLALQLETWCLAACEGGHVRTLLRVFGRKGSFIKVFHQSKVFFIHFVVHVFLSLGCNDCWGRVLSESSVFCCFLFSDWRCSSVCANREADPPATVASRCTWPGPVTVQSRHGFCASPSLQLHQLFIKPTQLVVFAFVLTTC